MASSKNGTQHPADTEAADEAASGEKPPVEFLVPAPLLTTALNVLAGLPYNHPIGDGRFCGDLVNALRQLQPVEAAEVNNG